MEDTTLRLFFIFYQNLEMSSSTDEWNVNKLLSKLVNKVRNENEINQEIMKKVRVSVSDYTTHTTNTIV